MIETACDLVGLQSLEVKADGLDAVSLPGADVLLLAAAGDLDTSLPEGIDIAHVVRTPQLNRRNARSS